MEGNLMKKALVVLLFMALGLSLAVASGKHEGGDDSQKGGLPALEKRVEKLEKQVAALISQVTSVQNDVAALKSVVASLQKDITTLKSVVASLQTDFTTLKSVTNLLVSSVLDLQGQNNWAVVDSSAGVVRHSGPTNITAAKTGTGIYEVTFGKKNVSGCAYTATIGDTGSVPPTPGFITVSSGLNKVPTDVHVQTYDKAGVLADSPFHLYVSCP
jgi:hypothetical protein